MHRTPEQNRKIWGLVAKLGQISGRGREWAEGIMRVICGGLTGSEKTSALTVEQADRLIAELQARIGGRGETEKGRIGEAATPPLPLSGSPVRSSPPLAPDPHATITRDQQRVLDHMYKDAGISVPQAFNQRTIKKPWPQTRGEANKIYQALEAMIVRRISRTEVETLLATLQSVEWSWRLTKWERDFIADLNRQLTAATGSGTWRTSRKLGKLLEIWRVRAEAKEMGAKPSGVGHGAPKEKR